MKIVEYKKHRIGGMNVTPEWIVKGDAFYNSTDSTWIGLVEEENDRLYYVPDTVVYLTIEQLHQRVSALGLTKLENSQDPHSQFLPLTEQDIDELIDGFLTT